MVLKRGSPTALVASSGSGCLSPLYLVFGTLSHTRPQTLNELLPRPHKADAQNAKGQHCGCVFKSKSIWTGTVLENQEIVEFPRLTLGQSIMEHWEPDFFYGQLSREATRLSYDL